MSKVKVTEPEEGPLRDNDVCGLCVPLLDGVSIGPKSTRKGFIILWQSLEHTHMHKVRPNSYYKYTCGSEKHLMSLFFDSPILFETN